MSLINPPRTAVPSRGQNARDYGQIHCRFMYSALL